jgi:uncharacterized protein YggE
MDIVTPFQFRGLRILFALLLLTLITLFGAMTVKTYRQSKIVGKPENVRDTISVSGRGEVTAIPDVAVVRAGLEITAVTVAEAQRKNTMTMNAFLDEVERLGVEDKDRKTVGYTIAPKYEERREPITGRYVRSVLIGYVVTQSLELKVRDFEKLGDVVALVGKHNLNQVGEVGFVVDKPDDLRELALEKAILAARAKAQALAHAGGVRLGRMISFYEGGGPMPFEMGGPAYALKAGEGMQVPMPAPRFEPGSQDIEANVTVTYELLP